MSAQANTQLELSVVSKKTSDEDLVETLESRRSNELILAFAGPIGCGISHVIAHAEELLRERGYEDVVRIKLSDFLSEALNDKTIEIVQDSSDSDKTERFKRYRRLQNAGKVLRSSTKNRAILAEYAVKKIVVDRELRAKALGETVESGKVVVPKKIAYLIDQVKRPEEVELLRAIYRNLFYVVGVTRIYDQRVNELKNERLKPEEVSILMEIDRYEDKNLGQQLDKTLHLADYFIRNDAVTTEMQRQKITRLLALVHGEMSITPTDSEHGMYTAYAAGLRSACLSRQVGAAIASKSGEILATGCNDVPKFGGGLYSASADKSPDMRCVHHPAQNCFNDVHKQQLKAAISDEVQSYLATLLRGNPPQPISLTADEQEKLAAKIYTETRLGSLIEFSRSVHAEMDAIVSLARAGGGSKGSTLYTTTFPCHSCARHIVAAGIDRVVYIEPYEKSMAQDLHADAIEFDAEDGTNAGAASKVKFVHFEGASPRKFQSFFRAGERKDKQGKFIKIKPIDAEKVLPEYLDNYQDFEAKTVEHLTEELTALKAEGYQK